jgi:hypothetical protein
MLEAEEGRGDGWMVKVVEGRGGVPPPSVVIS